MKRTQESCCTPDKRQAVLPFPHPNTRWDPAVDPTKKTAAGTIPEQWVLDDSGNKKNWPWQQPPHPSTPWLVPFQTRAQRHWGASVGQPLVEMGPVCWKPVALSGRHQRRWLPPLPRPPCQSHSAAAFGARKQRRLHQKFLTEKISGL